MPTDPAGSSDALAAHAANDDRAAATHRSDSDPVVIVGFARTPMGSFQGVLSALTATELGARSIRAAVERAGIEASMVDEVYMGCVLPAGLGQAPARQAALGAGLELSATCTTVNKMCGSGMKAVMLAHDALRADSARCVVAGGFESMSNAPYLLPKVRDGLRMGHGAVKDHMFLDGLEDAYESGRLMGSFAEETAQHYQFTREEQDAFAIRSVERARRAIADGSFEGEIVPVRVEGRHGESDIDTDEQPPRADIDRIPTLRPAFARDGTVTAANASSISDGSAALVMMRASRAEALGLTPLARILGHSSYAQAPSWFTTAPVFAIDRLLQRLDMPASQIDLYEINEAFAVVTMAAIQELGLDADKVNVNGGACALGHPIGASGARILCTLLNALHKRQLRRGIAALCIGGGEATAIAVERW